MKTLHNLLIAFAFISTTSFAGNEPIQKGSGNLTLNYQTTKYSDVFDNDGQLKPIPKISFSSVNVQGKFGLRDNLSCSFVVPAYVSMSNAEYTGVSSNSISGIGDISFGVSYALKMENKIQPVVSVFQNLPTGKNNNNGLNTGYGDYANSIFCDLFYEINPHFLLNGGIGYQNRKKYFKNDFFGDFYVNYIQKDKFQVSVFMKGKTPFTEVSNPDNIVNFGQYKNSEGYYRYGASACYFIRKNISLLINYEDYIKGQFIGNGPIYSAGIKLGFVKKEEKSDEK
ncbi:MAG: transporter [Bacteroidota bacterium]